MVLALVCCQILLLLDVYVAGLSLVLDVCYYGRCTCLLFCVIFGVFGFVVGLTVCGLCFGFGVFGVGVYVVL